MISPGLNTYTASKARRLFDYCIGSFESAHVPRSAGQLYEERGAAEQSGHDFVIVGGASPPSREAAIVWLMVPA